MRKRKDIVLAGGAGSRRGLTDAEQLHRLAAALSKTGYGAYLTDLADAAAPAQPAMQPAAELRCIA
jgi:hypothetical protein